MATRPAQDFVWATSGDKTDPGGAKKDVGFIVAERPPARWFNYLLNLIAQWIGYLEAVTIEIKDATIFEIRETIYPSAPVGEPATATEGRVGEFFSGFEDSANTAIEIRAAGTTAVNSLLPPYPTWTLLLLDAATSTGARIYSGYAEATAEGVIAALDDVFYAVQWKAHLGQVTGSAVGANNVDLYMGLHSNANAIGASTFDASTNSFVMFRKLSADTNWQCRVADGAGATTVDAGVPPVEDVAQSFRIEYHGLNTDLGQENGFATARFFIDGVQVAEVADANVPAGATPLGLSYQAYANATGPADNFGLVISPLSTLFREA